MRDDPTIIGLVTGARDGDKVAWDALVERFAPLVWSICRRFRLSDADSSDVGQTVWLYLIEQLPTLRVFQHVDSDGDITLSLQAATG